MLVRDVSAKIDGRFCRCEIGVPLEDLYGDRMDSLQDARDIVFNGFGVRDISFVIAVSESETWTEINVGIDADAYLSAVARI